MQFEKFNGKWKLKSSENFEQYMKEIGVNFATRKLGNLAKPLVTVEAQETSFYLKSENTFKTFEFKCTLGEEWDELAPDGRKCKSVITWDGEKFTHVQKWNGKETSIARFINSDEELVMECVMGDIKSVRIYTRI